MPTWTTALSTGQRGRSTPDPETRVMTSPWTEASFEDFHRETARGLWRYLCRTGGDCTVADDVLQESYLRLLARSDLEDDFRRRRAYLYRIATNLLRDRWRRGQRENDGLLGLANHRADDRGERADARLDAKEIRQHLDSLAPRERALLWLALVEGHSHREIAEILSVRTASVKVMVHRAKAKLATRLCEHGYRAEVNR